MVVLSLNKHTLLYILRPKTGNWRNTILYVFVRPVTHLVSKKKALPKLTNKSFTQITDNDQINADTHLSNIPHNV